MNKKSYVNEFIDRGWSWLPKDCELLEDTEDSCLFRLPSGGLMGVNKSTETWWRDTTPRPMNKYPE